MEISFFPGSWRYNGFGLEFPSFPRFPPLSTATRRPEKDPAPQTRAAGATSCQRPRERRPCQEVAHGRPSAPPRTPLMLGLSAPRSEGETWRPAGCPGPELTPRAGTSQDSCRSFPLAGTSAKPTGLQRPGVSHSHRWVQTLQESFARKTRRTSARTSTTPPGKRDRSPAGREQTHTEH